MQKRNQHLSNNIYYTFAAAAMLLVLCAIFSGCYTLKQGTTMLGYLGRAVPLETLLDANFNDADAQENRRFVELVGEIRRFAAEELGLNMSRNYTRYVSLDRSYLAAVVSASAADSFARHYWNYPVVGRLPYKGFFNPADAHREREKLEREDLDVWIRGVDAFSTLGWFRDPLFSYMRDYRTDRLADLIIHESLHATMYLKGQAQFNEELAEFVGSEGARLFMEKRYGIDSDEYRAMFTGKEETQHFIAIVRELVRELQVLYESNAGRDEKLYEKDRIIQAAQDRFDAEYDDHFTSDNFRSFSTMQINNAYLDLFRLYYADDYYIANLFEQSGKSLPEFIAAAKTMPTRRGPPGRQRLAIALGLER